MESEIENKTSHQIISTEVDRKLTDLEKRANALEKEFDGILKRTAEIELWTKQYESKVVEERRLFGLLHTLVRPGDKRTKVLMNHLGVFFNDVLTRLESKGIQCHNSMKCLYKYLSDENLCTSIDLVLGEMNFTQDEIRDLKLIIEIVHPRIKLSPRLAAAYELHCSQYQPSLSQKDINTFLQARHELDEPMTNVLKKMVATCYQEECKTEDCKLEEENKEF